MPGMTTERDLLERISGEVSSISLRMKCVEDTITGMKVELGVMSTKFDFGQEKYNEHNERIKQLECDFASQSKFVNASFGALKLSAWIIVTGIAVIGLFVTFSPRI